MLTSLALCTVQLEVWVSVYALPLARAGPSPALCAAQMTLLLLVLMFLARSPTSARAAGQGRSRDRGGGGGGGQASGAWGFEEGMSSQDRAQEASPLTGPLGETQPKAQPAPTQAQAWPGGPPVQPRLNCPCVCTLGSQASLAASSRVLPLVGNSAPDFSTTAVFDQEFIDIKLSDYKVRLHIPHTFIRALRCSRRAWSKSGW